MKVYLTIAPDGEITIMARAEGPGGLIGDMVQSVRPGQPGYAELFALGPGEHDLELPPAT